MGLVEQTTEAVRKWVYRPDTLDGRPMAVESEITVSFRSEGVSVLK